MAAVYTGVVSVRALSSASQHHFPYSFPRKCNSFLFWRNSLLALRLIVVSI